MAMHPDAPRDSSSNPVRWRAGAVAALAFFGAAAVFVLGVCTRWGQRFGDIAWFGRLQASPDLRQGSLDALETIRSSSLVLLGGALILTAFVRRRFRLAFIVCLVLPVSIGGAEFLKRTLVRPDLGIDPAGLTENWAPSGHTTVAATLVLCALMVVPRRFRAFTAIVGALYLALIAAGTLAAGWHRPTDSVMAVLWSLGVATTGVAVLVGWRGVGVEESEVERHEHEWQRRVLLSIIIALPMVVLIGSFVIGHRPVIWNQPSSRFFIASIVIDIVSVAAVLVFAQVLRGVSLDAPNSRSVAAETPAIDELDRL